MCRLIVSRHTLTEYAIPSSTGDLDIPVVQKLTSDITRSTARTAVIVVRHLLVTIFAFVLRQCIQREESALLLWSEAIDRVAEEFIALEHRLRHCAGLCDCNPHVCPTGSPQTSDAISSIHQHAPANGQCLKSLSTELPELGLSFEFTTEADSYEDPSLLIDGVMTPPSLQVRLIQYVYVEERNC